jgi:hypothetical protein
VTTADEMTQGGALGHSVESTPLTVAERSRFNTVTEEKVGVEE